MQLKDLKKPDWQKKEKRVGRGGKRGTYSGRGNKGQKARSGGNIAPGFEGQDTTLVSRSPKINGFSSPKLKNMLVDLTLLEKHFQAGETVDMKALVAKKLAKQNKTSRTKKRAKVKILFAGTISKALTIKDCLVSEKAKKAILAAGGTVIEPAKKVQKVGEKKVKN